MKAWMDIRPVRYDFKRPPKNYICISANFRLNWLRGFMGEDYEIIFCQNQTNLHILSKHRQN